MVGDDRRRRRGADRPDPDAGGRSRRPSGRRAVQHRPLARPPRRWRSASWGSSPLTRLVSVSATRLVEAGVSLDLVVDSEAADDARARPARRRRRGAVQLLHRRTSMTDVWRRSRIAACHDALDALYVGSIGLMLEPIASAVHARGRARPAAGRAGDGRPQRARDADRRPRCVIWIACGAVLAADRCAQAERRGRWRG